MSTVAKVDISIVKAATFRHKFTWQQVDGTPIDLTGYTAKMQIRPTLESSTVLVELSTANRRILMTPLLGVVELDLTAAYTAAITWKSGIYDIELTAPDGDIINLVEGSATVSTKVTRE